MGWRIRQWQYLWVLSLLMRPNSVTAISDIYMVSAVTYAITLFFSKIEGFETSDLELDMSRSLRVKPNDTFGLAKWLPISVYQQHMAYSAPLQDVLKTWVTLTVTFQGHSKCNRMVPLDSSFTCMTSYSKCLIVLYVTTLFLHKIHVWGIKYVQPWFWHFKVT